MIVQHISFIWADSNVHLYNWIKYLIFRDQMERQV